MKLRLLLPLAALAFAPAAPAMISRASPSPARSHRGEDQVAVFSNNLVGADQDISGDAVAVMGDLEVDGSVAGDAVAVMGRSKINGRVGGDAVAVLGDLDLGPDARVEGDVVCVAGHFHRAPGAYVGGDVVVKAIGAGIHIAGPARQIWLEGFRTRWVWCLGAGLIALYALIALLFPGGIRKCGDVLIHRPGAAILAAACVFVGLPVVVILLFVTVVGVPVALFVLPALLIVAWMYGRASFYALVGRAISGGRLPVSAAVPLGGALCLFVFLVPVAGVLLSLAVGILMIGCVVVALLDGMKRRPQAASEGGAVPPSAAPPVMEPPVAAPPAVPVPPPPPPPVTSAPAAGFWVRTAALLLDLILVGVVTIPFRRGGPGGILVLLAAYGAILWKLRGSTIGGIVCGLKVVRTDDRPLDWATSIVRALACFLSLVVFGLGFLWVLVDSRRQSWHDKIAGTLVVRPPRGVSLV